MSAAALLGLLVSQARAQDGPSAGASAGPIGEASRPVGEGAGTVRDHTTRGMLSGPSGGSAGSVRDSSVRGMLSGPVSELSAGPVSRGQSVYGRGSLEPSSLGAVREKAPPPPLERPVTEEELQQLQEALRGVEPIAE